MKLKAGDTVTIREDLQEGKYGSDNVVEDMLKYCGKSFKVAGVRENGKIDLEGVPWNWTPEMFEEKPSEITLEIGYRFLTDTHVRTSSQTVTNDDYAYENACEQFLEEYMKDYDYVEGVDICFVREAVENA